MSNALTLPALPTSRLLGTDVPTLVSTLKDQFSQRLDVVVPRSSLRVNAFGDLEFATIDEVSTTKPIITEDGVTTSFNPSGAYALTNNAEAQIATMFKIPLEYFRRTKVLDPAFYASQVNEWAKVAEGGNMLRLVWGSVAGRPELTGVVRAVMSDKYKIMDNFDATTSIFEALGEIAEELGINIGPDNIRTINLTEDRLYIDINVPEIAVNARSLVENYVSPFSGLSGKDLPLMNAGIRFTNSEIGKGRLQAIPFANFQICGNGAQMNPMAFAKTHLGGKLEQGVIRHSVETMEANEVLVKSQLKDAVRTYLSTDFLNQIVDDLEVASGKIITKPETTIELVAKEMKYTEERADAILGMFMKSRDFTSGGVYHAVTAAAVKLNGIDPDAEYELSGSAPQAMKVAARVGV